MAKKQLYRAAVIGAGYIGAGVQHFDKKIQPATHAGVFEDNSRTELIALADPDKSKLDATKRYFPKARLYTSPQDMLEVEKLDIVSIASPTPLHYEHVILAAKHRVPVILCEKPLADTIARGRKMVEVCEKAGVQLFVNYQRHFDPLIQKWAKKIKNGDLGKLYQGNVYYYNGLANNAGHMIDLLNLFLGMPEEVDMRFNPTTETKGKGPNADGTLRYKDNLLMTLQSLSPFYGYFALTFIGEKGMLSITKNTSPEIEFRKKIQNKEAKLYFQLVDRGVKEGEARSMFAPMVSHLVSYLDGKVSPISIGKDGLAVLEVLDALLKSAEKNKREVGHLVHKR